MSNLSYDLLLVGELNKQSLVPKINDLGDYIKNINLMCLLFHLLLTIDNYILIRQDRNTSARCGGVLLYLNNKLKFQVLDISSDIEQLFVFYQGTYFVVGVTYRPPNSPYKHYIDSLESSLTVAMSYSENIVCVGDVNVNFFKNNFHQ